MGKIKNATPVGIYRSKLERYTAQQLELNKMPYGYEENKFVLVPSFRYTGVSIERIGKNFKQQREGQAAITYTPDFVAPDWSWIIECKGFFTPQARLKWKLFKRMLNERKIQTDLYMPTNQREVRHVIEVIKNSSHRLIYSSN